MKIILFSRPGGNVSTKEFLDMLHTIEECGFDYMINSQFARWLNVNEEMNIEPEKQYTVFTPDDVDYLMMASYIMVSYGGDGTLLEAVRMLGGKPVPVLGINSGHLGFLANAPKDDIKNTFAALKAGNYTVEKRSLLHIQGDFEEEVTFPYAFNEFSIQRHYMGMIGIEVEIDGEKVVNYHSDGALIATPTGSTAYALSAGGPIVAPQCDCFIVAPIAPHNLTMRPIVIPDSCRIRLRVDSRDEYAFVGLDNENYRITNGAVFEVSKAEESVYLIRLQNISFYDTLRNKMMWGLDGRDKVK